MFVLSFCYILLVGHEKRMSGQKRVLWSGIIFPLFLFFFDCTKFFSVSELVRCTISADLKKRNMSLGLCVVDTEHIYLWIFFRLHPLLITAYLSYFYLVVLFCYLWFFWYFSVLPSCQKKFWANTLDGRKAIFHHKGIFPSMFLAFNFWKVSVVVVAYIWTYLSLLILLWNSPELLVCILYL